jgi:glycosyltransferase involved in cell wall biosynthesis
VAEGRRGPRPRVSVVLTTRNLAKILRRTLECLTALDTTGFDLTVVVADNGSTDETPGVLAEAASREGVLSIYVREPGKNRALNEALTLAQGELIAFTDDDVLPEVRWLAELVAATERWPDADVFGGQTLLAAPPGAPNWILESGDPSLNFARYAPLVQEGVTSKTPHGPNFAIRSAVLESFRFAEGVGPDGTGGYAMGSETEFLLRVLHAGRQIVYVPTARLRHIVRPEQLLLPALVGRSYRGGRGWARLHHLHADVPYLMGAPRWLWRELARAAAGRITARLSSPERRLACLLTYHRIRGMIAEHRSGSPSRLAEDSPPDRSVRTRRV